MGVAVPAGVDCISKLGRGLIRALVRDLLRDLVRRLVGSLVAWLVRNAFVEIGEIYGYKITPLKLKKILKNEKVA